VLVQKKDAEKKPAAKAPPKKSCFTECMKKAAQAQRCEVMCRGK
jgi:hypothetical protein